jgi:hypothetical protein
VEGKFRSVNCGRVSDRRRAVRPASRVTEISADWNRSTMGVTVISLGTSRSAGENFGCTWEPLRAQATSQGVPATNPGAPVNSLGVPMRSLGAPRTRLGAPMTHLGAPATGLGAHRITVEQSGNDIVGNAASVTGNHSYYLSFDDC